MQRLAAVPIDRLAEGLLFQSETDAPLPQGLSRLAANLPGVLPYFLGFPFPTTVVVFVIRLR